MKLTIDPLTGLPVLAAEPDVRVISQSGGGHSSGGTIPEVTADPVSPNAQDAWVLRSGSASGGGSPLGLLLALTTAGTASYTYQLKYYTNEGTTVATTLS